MKQATLPISIEIKLVVVLDYNFKGNLFIYFRSSVPSNSMFSQLRNKP